MPVLSELIRRMCLICKIAKKKSSTKHAVPSHEKAGSLLLPINLSYFTPDQLGILSLEA